MTPDTARAFWAVHSGLPRQGPGEPADVEWATRTAAIPPDARICDAGCGPGADLAALLAAAPEGHVTAIEQHADFVEAAVSLGLPRLDVFQGDMAEITGPYDFIWSAGALYFLGVAEGLDIWRRALAPGGSIAFSEICWLTADPPEEARAFWSQYPAMTDDAGLVARIEAAGCRRLDRRILGDAAWEAYYGPVEARLAQLRLTGDHPVWDETAREIALWRRHRRAFGYVLSVVRPA